MRNDCRGPRTALPWERRWPLDRSPAMLSLGGPNRRDFLRIGTLGLGGLSLSQMLAGGARAASGSPLERSVIFVFQHGGPSQFETWDPKPDAPEGIRTATGAIATRLPGVVFGPHFPRLARLADRLAIVRSYVPGDAGHD